MRPANVIITAIIVLSFAMGAFLYPSMPALMPSHWNAAGEVDGYMTKGLGLFLMPAVSLLLFLLFLAIPGIDPLKENLEKFRGYFDGMVVLTILFLLYVYALMILWAAGAAFDMVTAIIPALAALFYYMGVLIGHSRRNWFVGIRTPWTLSSDRVWKETHRRGGRLFKAAGAIALLGLAFPGHAIWLVLLPIIAVAAYTVVYSYLLYRRYERR